MRIIGGQAAGRIIRVPEGLGVRPMPDKVKLAVFNSLGDRVVDAQVLDLFAGTGALGHECLSRGARSLYSVERSEKHARCYRHNLAVTGLPESAVELRVMDVFSALPHLLAAGRRFDLVIADPPYGEKNLGRRSRSAAQRLLDDPSLPQLLVPGGLFILGHARRDTLELGSLWVERRTLRHGDTLIRFLDAAAPPPTSSDVSG